VELQDAADFLRSGWLPAGGARTYVLFCGRRWATPSHIGRHRPRGGTHWGAAARRQWFLVPKL